MQNLPKHNKYKEYYKPNDTFWGLGVEHETYLETSKLKQVTLKELKENNKRERYCVDYLTIYDKDELANTLDGLFDATKPILIPILANSHTFQRTDINGEHKTTYERIPKPNPKFNGKTIFELIQEQNPEYFKKEYEASYLFDGDTIEFVTQDFYKATVISVIEELEEIEKKFINAINSVPRDGLFKTYAPFKIAEKNYGFASYLTNLKNNAMFNNGTLHINITLPTRLDQSGNIQNFEEFREKHRNYARAIQWLSPLIVAKYGAEDPLCESKQNGEKFSAGSQRVAVSRYIGLGTYDTDTMEVGKILTRPRSELKDIDWYDALHEQVGYKFLDELGMDINFNKHYSHGIEFRILEALPTKDLKEIMTTLIYLADYSAVNTISNPKKSKLWHRIAKNCVHDGKGYLMDVSDQNDLYDLFGICYLSKEPVLADEVYNIIATHLMEKYQDCVYSNAFIKGIYEEEEQKEQKEQEEKEYSPLRPTLSLVLKPMLETIPEISSSSSSVKSVDTVATGFIATPTTLYSPVNTVIFNNILPQTPPPSPINQQEQEQEQEKQAEPIEEVPIVPIKRLKWFSLCC